MMRGWVGGGGGWEEGVGGRRGWVGGGGRTWQEEGAWLEERTPLRCVCASQALCSLFIRWPHPHGGRVQAAHTPLQITAPLFVFHRPSAPSAAGSGLIPMAAESKQLTPPCKSPPLCLFFTGPLLPLRLAAASSPWRQSPRRRCTSWSSCTPTTTSGASRWADQIPSR